MHPKDTSSLPLHGWELCRIPTEAAHLVPVITLAYLAQSFYYPTVFGLFYQRKTQYLSFITGGAAALNIGLNVALIPGWGINAAAWSKLAAYVALALITYLVSRRIYPVPWEYRRIATLLVVACGLFAVSACLEPLGLWARVGLRMGLCAAFPLLLWLTRFPRPKNAATSHGCYRDPAAETSVENRKGQRLEANG